MKSAFIAILGRPNAGKSSLLNAMLGQKVSIVSPKPQTTREKITGILNLEDCQIIFSDTPGIHKPRNELGEYMQKNVNAAAQDVDAVLIVADVSRQLLNSDIDLIQKYSAKKVPVVVALNKIDISSYERVYPQIERLNQMGGLDAIIPVSAKTGKNIDVLINELKKYLIQGPAFYSQEDITDRSERFIAGELIREKALLFLREEIPHGIGVAVSAFVEQKDKTVIDADLYVEKNNHKIIVIGNGGEMLKKIGSAARLEIERMLNKHVVLNIFVKVREDWRNSALIMDDLGYK